MVADTHHDGTAAYPAVGRFGGVVIIEAAARRIPPVHGVLCRLQRGLVWREIDLSVVDRRKRALLTVVLSRIFSVLPFLLWICSRNQVVRR